MNSGQGEPDKKRDLNQLASVGEIAAGIAHEVKNPLTTVKGFLQLMREKNDPSYVDIAETEVDHAISTLESLLEVSKPDVSQESFETISLIKELELILQLFQDRTYDVDIHIDFRDETAYIFGNKSQIKKALFNLIKNAFEAIPARGSITIRHYIKNDHVIVEIQDTGIGIPHEKLSMLGTPFFTTKEKGTGIGLTQVFTAISQHKGRIDIESEKNKGTKFLITIPQEFTKIRRGVIQLELNYHEEMTLQEFLSSNQEAFEERLMNEAVNVKGKINEIHADGNINLLANVHKLVLYIVDGREHDMIRFAKQEGIAWSKYSLSVAFKLEWMQAVRRTLWDFLFNYDRLLNPELNRETFFNLEKQINEMVDQFLRTFFLSYSQYKDQLYQSQREVVEDLSVPIIPLTPSISILPIIGDVDLYRLEIIEEKLMNAIGESRIETLVIDLSGMMEVESNILSQLMKILEGISLMGCHSVVTGMRPDTVRQLIHSDFSIHRSITVKGTLQQALIDYLLPDKV